MMLDPVLVHQIFGALMLGFATAVLLRALKVIRGYWSEYLPASALVTLGALLAADPWIFHGGSFGSEGNQHVAQGLIAFVAGGLEWFRVRRRSRNMLLLLVVPLVLSALGLAFLWHPQHAGGDMTWETVGQPRLLVIGPYRMGFDLVSVGSNTRLRVAIDYQLPMAGASRLLGQLFGRSYARWCVRQMAEDAQRSLAS